MRFVDERDDGVGERVVGRVWRGDLRGCILERVLIFEFWEDGVGERVVDG